jgi:Cys-tRNA(Pro)/Cys-tRNA(Cys) deacylase
MRVMKKTNAARLLDTLGVTYELREYIVDEDDLGAETVARKIGMPPEQVFKTLVTRGDRTGVMLAIVPATCELNLHKLAAVSGNKRVTMVELKEVQPLTGYIRGGVSPIGTKRAYPTYLDDSALAYPHIAVSAGQRGLQCLLAPHDLLRAVQGQGVELV